MTPLPRCPHVCCCAGGWAGGEKGLKEFVAATQREKVRGRCLFPAHCRLPPLPPSFSLLPLPHRVVAAVIPLTDAAPPHQPLLSAGAQRRPRQEGRQGSARPSAHCQGQRHNLPGQRPHHCGRRQEVSGAAACVRACGPCARPPTSPVRSAHFLVNVNARHGPPACRRRLPASHVGPLPNPLPCLAHPLPLQVPRAQ